MLKWVDSWPEPKKKEYTTDVDVEETLLHSDSHSHSKCELPNSCALCVVQFVAQKFDMNQVPRVALAKFR